jgi:hypothetical protein
MGGKNDCSVICRVSSRYLHRQRNYFILSSEPTVLIFIFVQYHKTVKHNLFLDAYVLDKNTICPQYFWPLQRSGEIFYLEACNFRRCRSWNNQYSVQYILKVMFVCVLWRFFFVHVCVCGDMKGEPHSFVLRPHLYMDAGSQYWYIVGLIFIKATAITQM